MTAFFFLFIFSFVSETFTSPGGWVAIILSFTFPPLAILAWCWVVFIAFFATVAAFHN